MTTDYRAKIASLLPVTILTGFLGSGKTTVLNHLLGDPILKDAAVLINEFGEVAIDHLLVRPLSEEVVLLSSGCLCCSVRGDLVEAMRDLYVRRAEGIVPEFGRVLIETTGLADPAPIIHTLMSDPMLQARYRLDGILCTVDAVNGEDCLNKNRESVKQAAVADRLLLTKLDLAKPESVTALRKRLFALNPGASVIEVSNGDVFPDQVLNCGLFDGATRIPDVTRWLNEEAYEERDEALHHDDDDDHDHHEHHHHIHHHDDSVSSFVFTFDQPVKWDGLVMALQFLISTRGENLLRVKGIVNAEGYSKPLVIHGVQHLFHDPVPLDEWPDADHRTRIVFITRDLPRDGIEELFTHALTEGVDNV